jgi:hypothetical protein
MHQVEREEREADARERQASANRRRIAELEEQTTSMTSRVIETARDVAREIRDQREGRARFLRDSDRGAIITARQKICPPMARGPRFYVDRRERKAREYSIAETARRTFEGWEMGVSYTYINPGSADLGSYPAVRHYVLGTDGVLYVETGHGPGAPMGVQPEAFEMLSAAAVPDLNQLKPEDELLIGCLEHLLDRQNRALNGLAVLTARHRRSSR